MSSYTPEQNAAWLCGGGTLSHENAVKFLAFIETLENETKEEKVRKAKEFLAKLKGEVK